MFLSELQIEGQRLTLIERFLDKFDGISHLSSQIISFGLCLTVAHRRWKEITEGYENGRLNKAELKKAHSYLVYKSLTIPNNYPKYKGRLQFLDFDVLGNNIEFAFDKISLACEQYIDSLLIDRSHVTLKIFQTLNYIGNYNQLEHYDRFIELFALAKTQEKNEIIPIDEYKIVISKMVDGSKIIGNAVVTPERLRLELLPPPLFYTDIRVKDKNDIRSNFNLLSSGERQLINVTSSIIYHLKNIDSIEVDMDVHQDLHSYKYVNIILDEIELYFHPEYQRQFIARLLFLLEKVRFFNLKGVNFMLVTHSPFILSDIPKNNVLFLDKGNPMPAMAENTFAANIHTLLQHGFFLNNSTIGQFAKDKVNELFRIVHEEDDFSRFPHLERDILLVSEPFLKSQLMKFYQQKKMLLADKFEHFNRQLLLRIEELERKLNDTNK